MLKTYTKSDLFSSSLGQFIYLCIVFFGGVIITRLLTPKEIGVFAVLSIINSFSTTLSEAGLSGALIREKIVKDHNFNTVFTINVLISISIYLLIIFFSNSINNFFPDVELDKLITISALVIIVNSFSVTQISRLFIDEHFVKFYSLRIISSFFGYSIGFVLALNQYGVYSLIYCQLSISLIFYLLSLYYVNSKFKFVIAKEYLLKIKSFSINTSFSGLLDVISDTVSTSLLAKYFNFGTVGNFQVAKQTAGTPINSMLSICQNLFYPKLCKLQDKKLFFSNYYSCLNSILIYTITIGCLGVCYFAESIIIGLYGQNYLEAVFYFQLLTIYFLLVFMQIFPRIAFKVFDKTKYIIQQNIIKKIILFLGIYYAIVQNNFHIFISLLILSELIGYLYFRIVLLSLKNIPLLSFKIDIYVLFVILFFWVGLNVNILKEFTENLMLISLVILTFISYTKGVFKKESLRYLIK